MLIQDLQATEKRSSIADFFQAISGRSRGLEMVWLALFSAVYFAGAFAVAANRTLWNDELFTYYIGRLPDFSAVWQALLTGAEQLPPFFYVITRASFSALGVTRVSIRLPEMLAFWAMCLCLYYLISRRSSPLWGAVGMLFPLVTKAFYYSTEARPYALVLGFSAFALVCWTWAAEGKRRWPALCGLALSIGAAVSCHYYAVLILCPLALGELVRSLKRRRIDFAVWVALGLGLAPLLLFLPLIHSASSYAATFWSKPEWISMLYFYHHFLLQPSTLPLLVLLLLVILYAATRGLTPDAMKARSAPRLQRDEAIQIPLHEIAAAIGFILIPAVGVILAKTVVGAFSDRYALPAVIGLAIILAWGLRAAFDASPAWAVAVVVVLGGFMLTKQVQSYRAAVETQTETQSAYDFLEQYGKGSAPILLANPGPFVELSSQRPPADLADRFLYLADPQIALDSSGTDDVEKGVVQMKSWGKLNVEPFQSFIASNRDFLIFTLDYPDEYEWVVPELTRLKWTVKLLAWQNGYMLFSASPNRAEGRQRPSPGSPGSPPSP